MASDLEENFPVALYQGGYSGHKGELATVNLELQDQEIWCRAGGIFRDFA
jgi:hypothetical protein